MSDLVFQSEPLGLSLEATLHRNAKRDRTVDGASAAFVYWLPETETRACDWCEPRETDEPIPANVAVVRTTVANVGYYHHSRAYDCLAEWAYDNGIAPLAFGSFDPSPEAPTMPPAASSREKRYLVTNYDSADILAQCGTCHERFAREAPRISILDPDSCLLGVYHPADECWRHGLRMLAAKSDQIATVTPYRIPYSRDGRSLDLSQDFPR